MVKFCIMQVANLKKMCSLNNCWHKKTIVLYLCMFNHFQNKIKTQFGLLKFFNYAITQLIASIVHGFSERKCKCKWDHCFQNQVLLALQTCLLLLLRKSPLMSFTNYLPAGITCLHCRGSLDLHKVGHTATVFV